MDIEYGLVFINSNNCILSSVTHKLPFFPALLHIIMITATFTLHVNTHIQHLTMALLPQVCSSLISMFGLESHINKTVKGYSGGYKRKLSAAIACLGDPDTVLMVSPTNKSKLQLWLRCHRHMTEFKCICKLMYLCWASGTILGCFCVDLQNYNCFVWLTHMYTAGICRYLRVSTGVISSIN